MGALCGTDHQHHLALFGKSGDFLDLTRQTAPKQTHHTKSTMMNEVSHILRRLLAECAIDGVQFKDLCKLLA